MQSNHTLRWKVSTLLVLICFACSVSAAGRDTVSLAGKWRFQLDRKDEGISARWYTQPLPETVSLPGTLAAQGIGDPITLETRWMGGIYNKSFFTAPEYEPYRRPGQIKVPFWLQPERYYAGAAWYQRTISIPEAWKGKRVVLHLERPHWETRVWLDERFLGNCDALATPHEYDLGTTLAPGEHTLTIRVDNRAVVEIGENSHSISDHTQGNWNGMAGRLELTATEPICLEDIQIFPRVNTRSITVEGRIVNAPGKPGQGKVQLQVTPGNVRKEVIVSWEEGGGSFRTEIALGPDAELWDEFHPALYRLNASLDGQDMGFSLPFGLREISTQNTQFLLNGRRIFFRGTLECAIFPLTGHPPTDVESWKRIIRIAKAHGLNHIRFHSWCPPEAAFQAADELGFYYQVECSSWANGLSQTTNHRASLGDGNPVDRWIYQEADRILKYYGNHPSILLMPYGNEPGGKQHQAFLAKWVNHYKEKDPRRLYTAGSGWPLIAENQFHVSPEPRIQAWGSGLKTRINALPPETSTDYRAIMGKYSIPTISHEIGQWCVYPNFDEIPKYQGYLKPRNFEIFRTLLESHGMGGQARDFLLASGKLQALCYKEDIESALRTPGMGGFQLLDLHDFPGQGTALVGVLDPFWDSKGYIGPEEFSRFCNSTVPLARLSRRVFRSKEMLEADIEVAHFGPKELKAISLYWKIKDQEGKTLLSAAFPARDIPIGNGTPLAHVSCFLPPVLSSPARYKFVVGLEGTSFENDWDIWVYPAESGENPPADVFLTAEWNQEALTRLQKGEKVLLTIPSSRVAPDPKLGRVEIGFSSIFWNTAWTSRQAPHTLGILCDPKHPALSAFPTEYHSNWQWWYLIKGAGAMILDGLPRDVRPIVQVIDDWFTARRLGLVFEARLYRGKLLVCSMDLQKDLDTNPVARQMRHSLLRYMAGPDFAPKAEVTPQQIQSLIQE